MWVRLNAMRSARALIVDDEPINLRLLDAILSKQGYNVLKATSGSQALDLMGSEGADIVLIDALMPMMDGFEVIRRLRTHMGLKTPVVMITGLSIDESRRLSGGVEAEAYIMKPIDRVLLLDTIKELLNRDER